MELFCNIFIHELGRSTYIAKYIYIYNLPPELLELDVMEKSGSWWGKVGLLGLLSRMLGARQVMEVTDTW